MDSEQKNKVDSGEVSEELREGLPRYRRLRKLSVIITLLVALIPLAIMTIINFYQDQESYRAESRYNISRILSNTKRTLEFVVEERRAAISLIISQVTYDQLSDDDGLKTILQNLNGSFGGFVDLGLIDSSGNQTYYVGPYELKGKNYKNQEWFNEVLVRGAHISDVFMGHRNLPHFVVAFRHERKNGEPYVLRATIDMEMINRVFYSLDLDRNTDAFLVNQDGVLQTASIFFGDVLSEINVDVPKRFRHREVIDEYEKEGKWVTSGYAFIEDTPFILMVSKQRDNPFLHWFYQRTGLFWFLIVSAALILVVVMYGSSMTIKRLQELDKRRARMLHNVEYTNKMATIGRMASGVAHEINNPLAIINEKAGLLNDLVFHTKDLPERDKFFDLSDSIIRSVERCSKVTHRLLGFARRMDAKKETIDVKELLEEVVGFQKTELAHRNIQVNYNFPPETILVESDRGLLQQVFLNIINNAFAAVDVGGHVEIGIDGTDTKSVIVSVTDDGIGISEDNLQHIFEPFYSTKGEFGTGLGLSITRDIMQKLEGHIDVKSKPGEGTTFNVYIPRRGNFQV